MERLIFPGNRFSYNMESVPNEVISIVIQLGGKWLEYFDLNALINSTTQNEGIYHIVVVNCNCVVYKSKRESKCFKTIEEALNKGMEEALEFLY